MADQADTPDQDPQAPSGPAEQAPQAPEPAAVEQPPTPEPAPEPAPKPEAEDKPEAPAEDKPEAPAKDKPEAQAPQAEAEPKAPEGEAASEPTAPQEPPPPPQRSAPPLPHGTHYFWGTGRRKKAVARVRIRPGTGKILMNTRELDTYFTQDKDRNAVMAPLLCVHMTKAWDIWANVKGGGFTGQAGAVKLGLARALANAMPDTEQALRAQGLLTRDARMVERKKPGQKGARKRFQFSKR